ncbi:unnamed protein product [Fusarium graminearum]|uniref:Chromosome 3, complete genome n=1 Tax=Gibberella zeae (strain ATCC MYA-4620 / CBS 123657 / FGSC 9075 / NRRL 31084 / PH-1) TaxID=229533 RepID=I1S786_GIBZE|nr:hypothetical protein FGSG_12709 [Fusarium graminearum PH-1]ESU11246.1 hypothetical protein FGSG_12709 [Fusarium graminearum PH-1]EYB30193.1 hypothetical protein FG05_12709 [Fusarium graminearum]CEF86650.1 unnamed protein product [Fusarium graminearum]CZS83900.1 unnamed protein product [Fusarium graminearum]|eukprot:XP_011323822.1 hypothetical protein FGSG_12709 [Fusarium graminearum PH-1]
MTAVRGMVGLRIKGLPRERYSAVGTHFAGLLLLQARFVPSFPLSIPTPILYLPVITFIRQRHVIVSTVAAQRSLLPIPPYFTAQLHGNAFKYPNELSALRRTPATTTAASATSAAARHIRLLFPAPTANSRIPTA